MDYWNVGLFVFSLGFTVVVPLIRLVVAVRGLGAGTLSEKQRRAGMKELYEAGIVRAGEAWDARDLDEVMLNLRRHEQWKSIGMAVTTLLTGGVGIIALLMVAPGLVNLSVFTVVPPGIWFGSILLGWSVGYFTSDRRFAAHRGAMPESHAGAMFTGPGSIVRRPRWLRWLDIGIIVGVSFCTLLYAIGKGGTPDNATNGAEVARYPWVIWCIPVALWIIVAIQELLVRWEIRRPPLRLAEQPELAGRADLHRRREAYQTILGYGIISFIPILALSQLSAFGGSVLSWVEFALLVAAFGALMGGMFAYSLANSRRIRQARSTVDAGLHGGSGVV